MKETEKVLAIEVAPKKKRITLTPGQKAAVAKTVVNVSVFGASFFAGYFTVKALVALNSETTEEN